MKVLVTGSRGQLGHALAAALERGATGVTRYEWLFTDVAQVDITDAGAVEEFFDRHSPDVVVNCAAYTDVDRAQTDRLTAWMVNCEGARNLARAAASRTAAMIHISTDFVFGRRTAHVPYTEDDPPGPLNIYGATKLAGEKAVLASGCRGMVIRTSWLYSPWGRNFVLSILRAAGERDQIRVVADQVGNPTSAASLAAGIGAVLQHLAFPSGVALEPAEVYNFCDAGAVSRAEFATEIVRQAGLECRVVPITTRELAAVGAVRPGYSALDTGKFERTFGVEMSDWRQALKNCLEELKN